MSKYNKYNVLSSTVHEIFKRNHLNIPFSIDVSVHRSSLNYFRFLTLPLHNVVPRFLFNQSGGNKIIATAQQAHDTVENVS
jgi:hypothetical protein